MTTIELYNLIISSLSTLLAAIAILLYIILWRKDKSSISYDVFDSTYLEILRIGIEYPELRNSDYNKKYRDLPEIEKHRYENYAFICWNFCESIYDKGNENLLKTWSVIIDTEYELHRTWFENPENTRKFKNEFRQFIIKKYSIN